MDEDHISPSSKDNRRRSTRVSALRAQEKLRGEHKENDTGKQQHSTPAHSPTKRHPEEVLTTDKFGRWSFTL